MKREKTYLKINKIPSVFALFKNLGRRQVRLKKIYFFFVLAVFLVPQATLFLANEAFAKTPVLGLRMDGQVVGFLGQKQLQKTVASVIEKASHPVTVRVGDYQETVEPKQIGAVLDPEKSTKELLAIGRNGSFWERLKEQDEAFFGIKKVYLNYKDIDEAKNNQYVKHLSEAVLQESKNASFDFQNNEVVVVGDEVGESIDQSESVGIIRNYVPSTNKAIVIPEKKSKAKITKEELEQLKQEAEKVVKSPVALAGEGKIVQVDQKQLVLLIRVEKPENAPKTTLKIDPVKIEQLLEEVAKTVNIAPRPQITDGEKILDPGKEGRELDIPKAKDLLAEFLAKRQNTGQDDVRIPLPFKRVPPALIVRKPKIVYLTIDDGPGMATEQVLDVLKKYGVHATFYLIGDRVLNYPYTAKRVVAEGHTVGNHSFTHPDLRGLTQDGVRVELQKTQDAIISITGVTPLLFRAPYSFYSPTINNVAASLGLRIWPFTVDPGDWYLPGASVIKSRVLARVRSGSVVVLHVNSQTAEALPGIIESLKAAGYTFK